MNQSPNDNGDAGAALVRIRHAVGVSRAAVAAEAGITRYAAAKAEQAKHVTDNVAFMAEALGKLVGTGRR
jgi:transcriptional regulator with XRE-family HTH domain